MSRIEKNYFNFYTDNHVRVFYADKFLILLFEIEITIYSKVIV